MTIDRISATTSTPTTTSTPGLKGSKTSSPGFRRSWQQPGSVRADQRR